MNWKSYWNKVALNSDNRLGAVQRNDEKDIDITVNRLISILDITKDTTVLDLCCGNGILTDKVASYCKEIIGIDQSDILIKDAIRNTKTHNISYVLGDVLQATQLVDNRKFDVIYLEFSFQYFDKKNMGKKLIYEVSKLLKPEGKFFIGNIPDKKKKWKFYNSLPKKFYYFTSKIRGKNPMGKFWDEEELLRICQSFNLKGNVLRQNKSQAYAYYRFDFLITK